MKKATILIIAILCFLSCQIENKDENVSNSIDNSMSIETYIKTTLKNFPDNGFDEFIESYGNPKWEFAHFKDFKGNSFVIPLENKGIINNVIKYDIVVKEGKEILQSKILNKITMEKANVFDKVNYSFVFKALEKKDANINPELLSFYNTAINKGGKVKIPEEDFNFQNARLSKTSIESKTSSTSAISSSSAEYIIIFNLDNWFAEGLNCLGDGYTFIEMTTDMNNYIDYMHSYGEDYFVQESVYISQNTFYVQIHCSAFENEDDYYFEEQIVNLMGYYEFLLVQYAQSTCEYIYASNFDIPYYYYKGQNGSCDTPDSNDPDYININEPETCTEKVYWAKDADNDGFYRYGSQRFTCNDWDPDPGYKLMTSLIGPDCDDTDENYSDVCSFLYLETFDEQYILTDKFCFSNASPGLLKITVKGYLDGDFNSEVYELMKDNIYFTIDGIGLSSANYDINLIPCTSTAGNSFNTEIIFTGLPDSNADFGEKTIKLYSYDELVLTKTVKIYFDKVATNNPSGNEPNWFYYWKEGNVCGIPANSIYDGSDPDLFGGVDPGVSTILYLGPQAPNTNTGPETFALVSNSVTGETRSESHTVTGSGSGIDCVAETIEHELYHLELYNTNSSLFDFDQDGIADINEATLDGIFSWKEMGDSYIVYQNSNYSDNEIRCRKKELNHSITTYPNKDWSKNGKQW